MATKKTTAATKEAAKAETKKTVKAEAEVKAPAKKTATKKAETKAVETKAVEAKVVEAPVAEVKEEAKKAPAKKAAAKKTTTKKAAAKVEVFVEFAGAQVSIDEVIANVQKANGEAAKNISIYLKPEESKAYFVADGVEKEMDVYFIG